MARLINEKVNALSAVKRKILEKGDLQQIFKDSEILSCFSGRIGNYIIRHQKGKPIISRRAQNFRPSQSEKAVFFRHKFAATQKFAKIINRDPILSKIWKSADTSGTTGYNRIIQQNIANCSEHRPGVNNSITPQPPHFLINEIKYSRRMMALTMNEPENCLSSDILVIKMLVYDPNNPADETFKLLNIDHHKSLFNASLYFTKEQVDLVLCYKKYVYFIAMLRETGNKFQWSNTYTIEGSVYN